MKSLIATTLLVLSAVFACNAQFFCNASQAATITNSPSALCDQYQVEIMNQQEYQSHPIMEVKVVFHFQGSYNGSIPTFSCGEGVPERRNVTWAVGRLMELANGILSNPEPERILEQPTGNDVIDTKFRFVLYPSSRNACGLQGIHIYSANESIQKVPGAFNFIFKERPTESGDVEDPCTGGGDMKGFNVSTIYNLYRKVNDNTCDGADPAKLWEFDGTLVHEFLHTFNASHAFYCFHECSGIDIDPYAHCTSSKSKCGLNQMQGDESNCNYHFYQNNNVMGYGEQQALTFCQVQKAVRKFMASNEVYPHIKPIRTSTQPIVITGKQNWSTGRIILNDIVIEPGGSLRLCGHFLFGENVKIHVRQGGRLYTESAVLDNLSSNEVRWGGIEVEGNPNLIQPDPANFVDFNFSPLQQPNEAGMAFITTGSIIRGTAFYGVKNFRQSFITSPTQPLFGKVVNSHFGGLIYATNSIFQINQGEGVSFYNYTFKDKSVVLSNDFRSPSSNNLTVGVRIQNMNHVSVVNNVYEKLTVGVNVVDAGASVIGGDRTTLDHFRNCKAGVYRSSTRDFSLRSLNVKGNRFLNTEYPVSIYGGFASSVLVEDNKFDKSVDAVYIEGSANVDIFKNTIKSSSSTGIRANSTNNSPAIRIDCNRIENNTSGIYSFKGNSQLKFTRNEFLTNGSNGMFFGTTDNPFDIRPYPQQSSSAIPLSLVQSTGNGPASNCFDFTDVPNFIFDFPYDVNYYIFGNSDLVTNPVNNYSCYQKPWGRFYQTNVPPTGPTAFQLFQMNAPFIWCGTNVNHLPFNEIEDPNILRNLIGSIPDGALKKYYIDKKNGSVIKLVQQEIFENDLNAAMEIISSDQDLGAKIIKHQAYIAMNETGEANTFLDAAFSNTHTDGNEYHLIQTIVRDFEVNQEVSLIPTIQINSLKSIAANGSFVSHYAKSALNLLLGELYFPNPIVGASERAEVYKEYNALEEIHPNLTLSPNPAQDLLRITFQDAKTGYIEIIDLNGQLLDTYMVREGTSFIDVNVTRLVPSLYFVKYRMDGHIVITQKFSIFR